MSFSRITQQEVEPLPRWARLALATRCLRRARILVQPMAADALILDRVLSRLDQATELGRSGDELADAAAAAYTLALNNIDCRSPDVDADVATCMVAHAGAFAAEAATLSDSRKAAHLVAQSIDFAIHACRMADADESSEAIAAMRADLEKLESEASSWTDTTPLPAGFFASL